MKNIFLIPTDKPSRLIHNDANQLCYLSNKSYKNDRKWMYRKKFNIYITSDEKIKYNDYITDRYRVWQWKDDSSLLGRKKVALTTDSDLIKDGVQAIDDEFLEWFVKNPSCEWVVVEKKMLCNYCGEENCDNLRCRGYIDSVWYEIIIPKEEPKTKCYCGHTTYCDCGVDVDFEIKQETLEEAADKTLQDEINYWYEKTGSLTSEDIVRRAYSLGITTGAKWQEERMYNEEEVLELLNKREKYTSQSPETDWFSISKWFEQFKKSRIIK
jgi:hypothetical protein